MAKKPNIRVTALRKHLQQEFCLKRIEVDVLTGDLLVNLTILKTDLQAAISASDWKSVQEAAQALQSVTLNTGLEDLRKIAVALFREAGHYQKPDTSVSIEKIRRIMQDILNYMAELE